MISDKLVAVDLEIASTCNAACPVCIRRTIGVLNNFKQQMRTLEDVKRIFDGIQSQISSLTLCGTIGDPMTCAEIVPICEWFIQHNPTISISISTNGGIGTPTQYARLGEIGVQMIFGVDGNSERILKLHRVNVSYQKVLDNMKAYLNNYEGDTTTWQYILFEQNKTDLLPALVTAKELGITNFQIRKPNGFAGEGVDAIPTYDFYTSKFTHWLTPVTDEFTQDIYGWWDISNDDQYIKIYNKLSYITPILHRNGPLWNGVTWCKPDVDDVYQKNPYSGKEKYSYQISEFMTSQLDTYKSQSCFSLNHLDNEDLTTDALNVFISHDNYVYPCCIVGGAITSSKTNVGDDSNFDHIKEMLNIITAYGIESFSVKNTTLKEILNSAILHLAFYNDMRDNNTSTFCKLACGKCSDTKKAYSPF